jgi:hypothetical protein
LSGCAGRHELKPSAAYAMLIQAAYLAAAGCLWAVSGGWAGAAAGSLLALLGAVVAADRALLAFPGSPRWLEFTATGEVWLLDRLGRRMRARTPAAWVSAAAVALPVAGAYRRTWLAVAGMLGPEPMRCLRLWGLWGRLPGVARGQRLG